MEQEAPKQGEGKKPDFKPAPDEDSNPTMEYDLNDPPRSIATPKGGTKRDFPEQPVDNLNAPPPKLVSEPIGGRPNPDDIPEGKELPPQPPLYTDDLPAPGTPEPGPGIDKNKFKEDLENPVEPAEARKPGMKAKNRGDEDTPHPETTSEGENAPTGPVLIVPNVDIKEMAARINEQLINDCLMSNVDHYFASNVLRFAQRTIGQDWVRIRDADVEMPVIAASKEEPAGSTAGDAA